MPKTNFCQLDPREENIKLLITFYMEKQGVPSKRKLSEMLHLTTTTTGKYIAESRKMPLGTLMDIADMLHIPAEDMAKALRKKPLRLDSVNQ